MTGDDDYSASQRPSSSYAGSTSTGNNYAGSTANGNNYSPSQTTDASYGSASDDAGSGGYGTYSTAEPGASPNSPNTSRLIFGHGINMQPSYMYNGDVDLGWNLLKKIPSVKTIRLEIESVAVDAAVRWIYEANSLGYKVIATYHNYDAIHDKPPECDPAHMKLAVDFWKANYGKLSGGRDSFIINIMNEWGHKEIKANSYADQYNTAIREIRDYYSGPLILDLPGSGQLAQVAADAVSGANGISPIQDRNIILSMHVYPITWNGTRPLKLEDVDLLASTGLPCIIGEFGESNDTPTTDWRAIVTYAKSQNWPALAWCWDGDGGIMNVMQPEFLRFVKGQPNPNYYLNPDYANIVLPFLS